MCWDRPYDYEDVGEEEQCLCEVRGKEDISFTPGVCCEVLCKILNKTLLSLVKYVSVRRVQKGGADTDMLVLSVH